MPILTAPLYGAPSIVEAGFLADLQVPVSIDKAATGITLMDGTTAVPGAAFGHQYGPVSILVPLRAAGYTRALIHMAVVTNFDTRVRYHLAEAELGGSDERGLTHFNGNAGPWAEIGNGAVPQEIRVAIGVERTSTGTIAVGEGGLWEYVMLRISPRGTPTRGKIRVRIHRVP